MSGRSSRWGSRRVGRAASAVAVLGMVSVLGAVTVLLTPPGASARVAPLEHSRSFAAARPTAPRPTATRPRVTLTPSRSLPVGATVALTGTVSPNKAGRTVRLQGYRSGTWHTLGSKKLTRRSAYTFKRAFGTAGATRLRVQLPRRGAQRQAVSPTRTIRAVNPGYDVSYPQCGNPLPAGATFGVVGVDGGRPYDVNVCLAEQITWAMRSGAPAYYANTANPGPKMSDHWPTGQARPKVCEAAARDSAGCAYDYGWNAAKDSFARAAAAATLAGAPSVASATWWLDVEMRNTWEALEHGQTATFYRNDTSALLGMVGYLHSRGVPRVGVYSTAHQWRVITGGASLGRAPVWYAGTGSATAAAARCAASYAFTGGTVRLVQFARGGFDADHRC